MANSTDWAQQLSDIAKPWAFVLAAAFATQLAIHTKPQAVGEVVSRVTYAVGSIFPTKPHNP
jgi:hypothetical protein